MKKWKRCWLAALFLPTMPLLGCGGTNGENLSTQSTTDPAKLQQARAEAQEAANKARAAEAGKTKGLINVEQR